MTLSIPLTPELEAMLRARAAADGKDVTAFVLDTLERQFQARPGFAEVFGPIHEAFQRGTVSDHELDDALESALRASRNTGNTDQT